VLLSFLSSHSIMSTGAQQSPRIAGPPSGGSGTRRSTASQAAASKSAAENEQPFDVLNELGRPPGSAMARRSTASQAATERARAVVNEVAGVAASSSPRRSVAPTATELRSVAGVAEGSALSTRASSTGGASSEADVASARTAGGGSTARTGLAPGDAATWAPSARTGGAASAVEGTGRPFGGRYGSVGGAASVVGSSGVEGAMSPSARSRASGMAVAAARALKVSDVNSNRDDVPNGYRCAVCDLEFSGDAPPGHCTACSQEHGGWLCRSCFSAHCRAMFPNHVASLAEDRLTGERSAVLSELGAAVPPAAACQMHGSAPNPALSLYCTAHRELVCAECVSEQHAGPGHDFVAATFAAAACR
jgi:hypothetical protein